MLIQSSSHQGSGPLSEWHKIRPGLTLDQSSSVWSKFVTQRTLCNVQGHLCLSQLGGATSTQWAEAMDTAKQPAVHRTSPPPPTAKNYAAHSVTGAKVKRPCTGVQLKHPKSKNWKSEVFRVSRRYSFAFQMFYFRFQNFGWMMLFW